MNTEVRLDFNYIKRGVLYAWFRRALTINGPWTINTNTELSTLNSAAYDQN